MEKIKIVFEDSEILVLDKPAGITVTSEGVVKDETVENWLGKRYENIILPKRNGIVHRLDRGTSGLLVVAKNNKSLENLQSQFKSRSVKKVYWALIGGDLPENGVINAPIGRSGRVFGKWRVKPEGKEAVTGFGVIRKLIYSGKIYSLVEISLKSGRTHQIRVHFAYLGWPLVGDRTYGGEVLNGFNRPFLQAKHLEFVHPENKSIMKFDSDLAPDLIDLLKVLDEKH